MCVGIVIVIVVVVGGIVVVVVDVVIATAIGVRDVEVGTYYGNPGHNGIEARRRAWVDRISSAPLVCNRCCVLTPKM